jgi:hypothetical protein
MNRYSERFNEEQIGKDTIDTVHFYLDSAKFFKQSMDRKCDLLQYLFIELKKIYHVEGTLNVIPFMNSFEKMTFSHCACIENAVGEHFWFIFLDKPSFSTFLHEFRHLIQDRTVIDTEEKIEDDACAWSHSLWKLASPKSFNRAVDKNLLLYEGVDASKEKRTS